MNNIRIKFTRGDEVKFISHLDLMKVFDRTLRRSDMPIAYSQGFNPHPQMVFGLPLSVGVTSEAEYADFEFEGDIKPLDFLQKMNAQLPKGICIQDVREKHIKGNIMAAVAGAVYDISIFLKESMDLDEISNKVEGFLNKDVIIVKKEGKNGIKDVNIRPMIRKLDVNKIKLLPSGYETFGAAFCLTAVLSAGSVSNIKPELVIAALSEETGISIEAVRIHRKELYVENDGKLVNPLEEL